MIASILLTACLLFPIGIQEKTPQLEPGIISWKILPTQQLLIDVFKQRYAEDWAELIKAIKEDLKRVYPDMPNSALYDDSISSFIVEKEKTNDKKN